MTTRIVKVDYSKTPYTRIIVMSIQRKYFPDNESFIAEALKLYSLGYEQIETLVVFGVQEQSLHAVDHCIAGLRHPETKEITWLPGFEKYETAMGTTGELIDFVYRYGGEILAKIDDEPNIIYELYNDALGYYKREGQRERGEKSN